MTATEARGLRRFLLLFALLAVAFDTRTAIASVSPIADRIDADLGLGVVGLSIVGMLPPLCFAAFAFAAPPLARRLGLEGAMTAALAAIAIGLIVRAFAPSVGVFGAASIAALGGVGIANVLLPPMVRRHFPTMIGGVTAAYVVAQSLGTAAPPLLAVPLAGLGGWRLSLATWGVVGLVALTVWWLVAPRSGTVVLAEAVRAPAEGRVRRSPTAWAIALLFTVASSHAYASMAWLPAVLQDIAGVSAVEAGALLALFGAAGVVPALLVPPLAVRLRNIGVVVFVGFALLLGGYLGLLLSPRSGTVVWVIVLGVGTAFFALCLVLVNLRARTLVGSLRMSSFVQAVGYSVGAIGPLGFGALHAASGSWTLSLVVFACSTFVAFFAGLVLRRPRYLEDEWGSRSTGEAASTPTEVLTDSVTRVPRKS